MQFKHSHDVKGVFNINASYFKDTYPILYALIYLDNISSLYPEESIELKNKTILYSEAWGISKNRNDISYNMSHLLAFYFYQLYKENKPLYDEKIQLFNKLIYLVSDKDILETLDINYLDLQTSFDYYLNNYEENRKKYIYKR